MDLQAHYQTFFTGVVVIGAVLLDIYRNKKASEVKILAPSDNYKMEMIDKINNLKETLSSVETEEADVLKAEIIATKKEFKETYAKMKAVEKSEKKRIHDEEKITENQLAGSGN